MTITAIPNRKTLANRSNAQLSTGPKTAEGKATSSRNALRTGLTGATVLLPNDDVEEYDRHIQRFAADFHPSGERETELVQALADTQWRLQRIPVLEAGIYALGSIEMADLFPEETPAVRALLIQSRTYLVYSRQLKNLHLQEGRLRRQYEKDLADLRKLQSDRKWDELFAAAAAAPHRASNNARRRGRQKQKSQMASNFQPSPSPSAEPVAAPQGRGRVIDSKQNSVA